VNVLIFGASGMVGQGVLRECLLDPAVERVLSVGRSPLAQRHAKLREIIRSDLADLAPIEGELSGYDACFFCLGVSAAGMSEQRYRQITYELTLNAATLLARLNPAMTFSYVSGMGTDSSERGRTMWARVKGQTENALLGLPFKAAYMFRPGLIQPLHGITSKTRLYRAIYAVTGLLLPLLRRAAPRFVTTTEQLGRAMIAAARGGAPKAILETSDINQLAGK
jgi:uncharacterized protein YbjT (DUF2867 family)